MVRAKDFTFLTVLSSVLVLPCFVCLQKRPNSVVLSLHPDWANSGSLDSFSRLIHDDFCIRVNRTTFCYSNWGIRRDQGQSKLLRLESGGLESRAPIGSLVWVRWPLMSHLRRPRRNPRPHQGHRTRLLLASRSSVLTRDKYYLFVVSAQRLTPILFCFW